MKHNPELYKKKLLAALEQTMGIVTPACQKVGVSRHTFYSYYRNDPEFKKSVDELDSYTLDYVESQLLKKITEGSEKSIMFYMKYKGRARGYSDNLDITTNGKDVTEIKLIEIQGRDDDEKINE